ncbi:Hypothetical predicted protein [Cloeon dipterum]|uniref:C-type lectin domain-containing protein n=1 Tax=Cloeon dipterum TaxID=197152 RepID=A0A8S1E5L1_9INSE|nr:Hypothetical predicted protein [Cloeon dipterum]
MPRPGADLPSQAPQRLGKWLSACDHSFLQLPNPYGTWDEAYKRCCSVGMDLLSIQNPGKQICLASSSKTRLPFSGQFWSSGRDVSSCPGKLRWCTSYLNDFLKKDLVWKAGQDVSYANNSCVYVDFDDPILPSLALADCSERKQFFCEAPSGAGYKSEMHATFCRRSFNVKQSEAIQIWNTGDLSQAGYGAKKMVQCLAEYVGLVYNSTKINEHMYFQMVSRMLSPL